MKAGKAENFAITIGIDRHDQAVRLREAGADVVGGDLAELSLADREKESSKERPPSALAALPTIPRAAAAENPRRSFSIMTEP